MYSPVSFKIKGRKYIQITGKIKPRKAATTIEWKGFCIAVKDELNTIFNPINKKAYLVYSAKANAIAKASLLAFPSSNVEIIISGIKVNNKNAAPPIINTETRESINIFVILLYWPAP